MRVNAYISLLISLLSCTLHAYGQHAYDQRTARVTVSVKEISFMVRNGDQIKDIATKTKIPVREILRINKLRSKHYLAYPGLTLILPVQVQSKVWDPTKEDMTGYSPSREDRSESEDDYEILTDSTNYRLNEDFIDLNEARYDSIEYSNIGTHMQKIDKHIKYLYHKLDSVKQTDFKFDYEDQDKNSILGKMKLTRDKYYAEGPIGKQIDSLKEEKTYLGQRLIVLRNQISEYEYLVDNARYSEAHYKQEEKQKPANWGDHLAYESLYMKNKAETEQARANLAPHDTAKKVITPPAAPVTHTEPKVDTASTIAPVPIVKTDVTSPKPVNTDMESSVPKVAQPSHPVNPAPTPAPVPTTETVAPKTAAAAPPPAPVTRSEVANPSVKITESDIATHIDTSSEDEAGITRYKSDFSILHKRMYLGEIKTSNPLQRTLAMLSPDQMAIKLAPPVPVIPKEAPKPQAPATSSKLENPTPANNIAKEVAQNTSAPQNTAAPQTAPAIITPAETAPVSVPQKQTSSIDTSSLQPHKGTATDAISANPPITISTPQKQSSNIDTSSPQLKKAIASDVTPMSVNTVATIRSDTPAHKQHIAENIDAAPAVPTTSISTSDQPVIKLESKIDTTIQRPKETVNTDPLASYKTDSDFVTKGVQIKDIPVEQTKNKPKYLLPIDSVSKIKGDFYLIRARQVLEKGDFKTGDKYLRKSLDLDPTNPQAWMLHADLFLTLGMADQALKEYEISGEIDSTNPKVFYNIALLYVKANNHQKAYKYFSKAIEVSDKYLLAYMGRASLLIDERDYAGAIQDYDRLLAINKYYSPAFKQRGLAKMELGKFADAILDFNQYLEIEDPDGYVIFQRGISKIYSNSLLQGCLDLSSAQELGFKDAEKAIKKFCE